jgi:hypothetical protein
MLMGQATMHAEVGDVIPFIVKGYKLNKRDIRKLRNDKKRGLNVSGGDSNG